MINNEENKYKPVTENPIILDFSDCKYLDEIHSILKTKFGLPQSCGENWDALWDCLRYLWSDGEHVKVEICGFLTLPIKLQIHCSEMLKVFDDVRNSTPNVVFEIIS